MVLYMIEVGKNELKLQGASAGVNAAVSIAKDIEMAKSTELVAKSGVQDET
jgi:hypothetical protein